VKGQVIPRCLTPQPPFQGTLLDVGLKKGRRRELLKAVREVALDQLRGRYWALLVTDIEVLYCSPPITMTGV
jgi:hypothetical protein